MTENHTCPLNSERNYITWITSCLAKLPTRHRAAFSGAAAERQFGTYTYFAQKDSRLKPDVLRMALDRVWAYAAGEDVPVAALEEAQQKVEQLIPDLDDPESPEQAPLVLDAVAAVSYAIRACLSGNSEHAQAAGLSARDAVHDWVDGLLHPCLTVIKPEEIQEVQRRIDRHPLMVREFEQVQREMDFLLGQPELDRDACSHLKALWPNGRKSNIDLE